MIKRAKGKKLDMMLRDAVLYGKFNDAKSALNAGAYIEVTDQHGYTPLHNAAYNGNARLVRLLIGRGASIEARTYGGNTPLLIAAWGGSLSVARVLLDSGASVNSADTESDFKGRYTPLHHAADGGKAKMARLLLERGANMELTDIFGNTPLMVAALRENTRVVSLLLQSGAKINPRYVYYSGKGEIPYSDGMRVLISAFRRKGLGESRQRASIERKQMVGDIIDELQKDIRG